MRKRIMPGVDLEITKFSGSSIDEYDAGLTNAIYEEVNGKRYITQRPSINIEQDASDDISDVQGRGLFYWDEESALYMVNYDTLYKTNYASVISAGLTAGSQKVHMMVLASLLIILDPENNKGWTCNTSDVVSSISDAQFPSTLAHGGAVLDGYLFVMDTTGLLAQSNYEDATAWTGTDIIDAERSPDGGIYLGKHHDHLVAFGVRTIEFFYNNLNPSGAIISRRQDLFYNIGALSGECVWEQGDIIFFIGMNPDGALGAYMIINFQAKKISNDSLDSFLTQAVIKDNVSIAGSGFTAHGRTFYIITLYQTISSVITPELTLAYDTKTGIWFVIESTVNSLTKLPLIGWSVRTSTTIRNGEGMLSNGDIFTIKDDLTPTDTLFGEYVTDDYVAGGYYTESGGAGTNISIICRHGQTDHGNINNKVGNFLKLVHDLTPNSQTITHKQAYENNASFSSGRTLDTSKRQKLNRLGRYERRNDQVEYSGSDRLQYEGIEIDFDVGLQ